MSYPVLSGRAAIVVVVVVAALLALPAAAQAPSPGPRTGALMVYDAARRQVLLFGGVAADEGGQGEPYPDDLWAWDGKSWRVLPVPAGAARPVGRDVPHLAYDAARQRVVMFGGRRGRGPDGRVELLSDSWEWDGARWHEIRDAGLPNVIHAATWYDPVRRRVGMYGGITHAGLSRTLSEWDGAHWVARDSAGPASPVAGAAVAPSGEVILLMMQSGRAEDSVASRVWLWDGASWTRGEEGPAVTSLQPAAGAPDGTLYLLQSWGPSWLSSASTYVRDARGAWTRVATTASPGVRSTVAAAYDAGRRRLVVYGGWVRGQPVLGDTWEFDGKEWARR
ncbi:MAG TPA: hypothetical protein VKA84_10995 [Gemmatimonadaceae bacterium]|nr:hypothetical protein [Gemmatimonadaceae bacterium]